MGFGFSTGDERIAEPYFYISAYPWPETIVEATLPSGAAWHVATWKGALLCYARLREAADAEKALRSCLRACQSAGAERMR